jgi:hypothetical protein
LVELDGTWQPRRDDGGDKTTHRRGTAVPLLALVGCTQKKSEAVGSRGMTPEQHEETTASWRRCLDIFRPERFLPASVAEPQCRQQRRFVHARRHGGRNHGEDNRVAHVFLLLRTEEASESARSFVMRCASWAKQGMVVSEP